MNARATRRIGGHPSYAVRAPRPDFWFSSEWETDNGAKRQAVEIVADTVQFLGQHTNGAADEEQTS
jgi:hypothetical protein